jgi:hypothetical protein
LVGDQDGYVYASVGNGDFTADQTFSAAYNTADRKNYGSSVLRLNPSAGMKVDSYYTPQDFQTENVWDLDLGSAGPMMLPGTKYMVAAGKSSRIFLLQANALPGYDSAMTSALQYIDVPALGIFGAMAFFNNTLYVWGGTDVLRAYQFQTASNTFNTTPLTGQVYSTSCGCWVTANNIPYSFANQPAMSISANGTTNGIVWASYSTNGGTLNSTSTAALVAFDAGSLHQLYSSDDNPNDKAASWAKWVPPTVANGKVYLASFSGQILVYGLTQ